MNQYTQNFVGLFFRVAILMVAELCHGQYHCENRDHISFTQKQGLTFSHQQLQKLSQACQTITHTIENKLVHLNSLTQQQKQKLQEQLSHNTIAIIFVDDINYDALFISGTSEYHESPHILIHHRVFQSKDFLPLLIHEIIHWVHYLVSPLEEQWIKEGVALIYEYLTRGSLNVRYIQAPTIASVTSFFTDYDLSLNDIALYSQHLGFFYYIYKHFGGISTINNILLGKRLGYSSGHSLIEKIVGSNFTDLFTSYQIARHHNSVIWTDPVNSHYELHHQFVMPQNKHNAITTQELSLPPYSALSVPMDQFPNLQMQCESCLYYFSQKTFPYALDKHRPMKDSKNWWIIMIRLN